MGLVVLAVVPALLWCAQIGFVLWNLREWKPVPSEDAGASVGGRGEVQAYIHQDSLSILIPARNEADRISACLESIFAQVDEEVEVLVLNDRSGDSTPDVLAEFASRHPNMRVIEGADLPEDWYGKPHACWQLAERASGDWLLFLDADVRLAPDALSRLRFAAARSGADLISGFGRLRGRNRASFLLTSLMAFVIAMHLPLRLVERSSDARFVAANGALLLVRSAMYHVVGGHEAQRTQLVEDMAIGRAVKKSGGRVWLADLSGLLTTEMYDSFRAAWLGYRKNIFPGLGRSYAVALFVELYYFALFVLPVFTLVTSVIRLRTGADLSAHSYIDTTIVASRDAWSFYASLWSLVAAFVAKRAVDARFHIGWRVSIAACLSAALLMGVLVASIRRHLSGKGYDWKGRVYT